MPLLIDGNSPAGQAVAKRQAKVATSITVGVGVFQQLIVKKYELQGGLTKEDLIESAQFAITAGGTFAMVADSYADAELNPRAEVKPIVELEG